jgi:phosphate starvation-inducible protein PhoH and related proteins
VTFLTTANETALDLEFKDNRLLPLLFGERDRYLHRIESRLGITIQARGNRVLISGHPPQIQIAETVLNKMYDRLVQGQVVSMGEIDAAIRLAAPNHDGTRLEGLGDVNISTRRRVISPRSEGQIKYIQQLKTHDMTFALGPAGTGKTYLATAMAIAELLEGNVERIILSRPAVEAGEKLGFLPGDMREKVDPYLRPLYDALYDMLPPEQVEKRLVSGEIEVAPLAFMRGRTLSHAFVILDEAQNTTTEQMKMFLTRLGDDSKMVVTGDLTQVDLPRGVKSGLVEAVDVLTNLTGIAFSYLTNKDVMRHPLVAKIVQAYDQQH